MQKILGALINAKYRIGTTGTLDDSKTHKLVLEGLFGTVHQVTTTRSLIDKKQLADLKLYKKELEVVIRKEEERARLLARGGKAERSIMGGDASSRASESIGEAGGGMGGSWKGFKIAGEEFKKYRVEMEATAGVQGKLSKQGGVIGKVMNFAAKSFIK